ncbi:MAG: PAS domain-containing hybrid sensor histidine kinase/response regulator [Limisphaerales bacterium]
MSKPLRVLMVEDSEADAELIVRELRRSGYEPVFKRVETAEAVSAALDGGLWDVVISDHVMPQFSSEGTLRILQQRELDLPLIIVSGSIGEAAAVTMMKAGASDYIMKDDLLRLVPAVEREIREAAGRRERRKAEAALKRSQAQMRCLVNANILGVMVADTDGQITEANDAFLQMVGFSREEVLAGQVRWDRMTPPEWREGDQRILQQVRERGVAPPVEKEYFHKDGRRVPVLVGAAAYETVGGNIHCVAFALDLTKRKQTERELHEQARLLDLAQDAIVVRDLERRVVYWNKGAERLYGWTAEEARGRPVTQLMYRGSSAFEAARQELLQQGEWSGEMEHVTKQDLKVVVHSRWNLVVDEQGKPRSVLVINTDLTETKKLETQFFHAQRLESIGTLASGIAHDLNNVLAPILMATEMLRTGGLDEDSTKILDTIHTSAQRGADIVQQVLTFARGAEGKKVRLQPGRVVTEVAKLLRQTLSKSITIKTEIAKDLWTVNVNATQLHQVLLNLCVNARDAMPEGGRIELTGGNAPLDENFVSMMPGAHPGPHVRLRVTDTGAGIPRAILAKIFDPFFTTKEVGKGTGLGLSTVQGIVRSLGGFVTVESEIGKGSTFDVYLPAASGVATEECVSDVLAPADGRGELVLVVDDEAGIRDVTRRVLEKHRYQVITASDGAEALAVLSQNPFGVKVVLTDVVMPNLDGITLIRVLRRINPQIRIIVSSGAASAAADGGKGAELEALKVSAKLSKPYTTDELLAAMQKALRQADAGDGDGR